MAFEAYDGDELHSKGCLVAENDAGKDIEVFLKDSAESYRVKCSIEKEAHIITTAFNRI